MFCLLPFTRQDWNHLVAEQLSELEIQQCAGDRFTLPLTIDQMASHLEDESRTWWSLKVQNEWVGMGELQQLSDTIVKISRVYISKVYRGRGYGEKLMQLLISEVRRNQSIEKVCLNVYDWNEIAISLYRKINFNNDQSKSKWVKVGKEPWVLLRFERLVK